jgi:tRNA(adenine34) deaminase
VNAAVHKHHMHRAIEIARNNLDAPFGTVIAERQTGEVMTEGLNDAEKSHILHGEIDAIMRLAETRPDVDWRQLVLYIIGEPGPMCSGATLWCGIPQVVFGASIENLERLGFQQIGLTCEEVAATCPSGAWRSPAGCWTESATPVSRSWYSESNNFPRRVLARAEGPDGRTPGGVPSVLAQSAGRSSGGG